jgi:hypothetical protein
MPIKAAQAAGCGAEELTAARVQAAIGGIRTDGRVTPNANLPGTKADAPNLAAIPEGEDFAGLPEGGGKDDAQGGVLKGVGIIDAAPESLLETGPFGCNGQLFGDSGEGWIGPGPSQTKAQAKPAQ